MKENTIKAALAAALGALCAYGIQLLVPVLVLHSSSGCASERRAACSAASRGQVSSKEG